MITRPESGSGTKRRKVQKEAKAAKYLSKNEKKLVVHKYLGKGKPRAASRKRISDPWADEEEGEPEEGGGQEKRGNQGALSKEAIAAAASTAAAAGAAAVVARTADEGDLQGGDGFEVAPRVPGRNVKRPKQSVRNLAKLSVCHPGQSYNPTEEDHEDVLASAVAVELKRQEAIEEERAPISAGMSKETLALIIGDEDDESSSDEEDDGNASLSLGKPTPASGKLTRAQRNKQKRAKAAKYELAVKKNKKQMAKSIDHTGVAAMGSARCNNKDVIAGRSVPVNLGEELFGSLRQLKAQGSVLLDKVELLKANKAHPDRRRGKERAKKAPKGFKKKHTYKDRYKDD
ncbi:unnamed protein product [Hapterophycus canaliculatus]